MSSYQLGQCIWKYSRGEYRIERGGAGYVDDSENRLRRARYRLEYIDIGLVKLRRNIYRLRRTGNRH